MSFMQHLVELRNRLMVVAVAVAVGTVVGWFLFNWVIELLIGPYRATMNDPHATLLITDPIEGLTTRFKLAAFAGVVIASPVVLWQLWRFITPGLHTKEKRYAIPFVVSSIVLFLFGAALAVLTLEPALQFLQSVGGPNFHTLYTPDKYLRLVTLMVIAFGAAFELPVLLVSLELAGAVSSARLRKWRRPAVVLIVGFAALITPSADPYSLFGMAIPMYLFYEGSIIVGKALGK